MSRRSLKNKVKQPSSPELTDDEEIPAPEETKPLSIRSRKKRSYNSIDVSGGGDCNNRQGPSNVADFGNDIQSLLGNIGTDFSKSRSAKRQRLEQYTTGRNIQFFKYNFITMFYFIYYIIIKLYLYTDFEI